MGDGAQPPFAARRSAAPTVGVPDCMVHLLLPDERTPMQRSQSRCTGALALQRSVYSWSTLREDRHLPR